MLSFTFFYRTSMQNNNFMLIELSYINKFIIIINKFIIIIIIITTFSKIFSTLLTKYTRPFIFILKMEGKFCHFIFYSFILYGLNCIESNLKFVI